ncbi:SGNH/GDSL hydrolase family protein [Paenarthrobacter sp. YIM B13468]|uniref:SGNH/GDSL hydrolase family protein n=1 Tax=Paenarthrobacter sp. YIM B13468 TaxID=3366295 RepID=UPI00366CF0A3
MATHRARRRNLALAGGLAALALTLGFTASPATAAPPSPVNYVALGDSYTAGTGAGDLYRPPVACWQSSPGYVDDVAETGRVALVANLACHGAVLFPAGPFYDGVTPSVFQQITSSVGQSALQNAGLVSITAGAVDAGSLLALQNCSTPDTQLCEGTVSGIIANLPVIESGLEIIYQNIRASAPEATLTVMGYPRLFDPANGLPVIPPANQSQVNLAVDALNATIAKAVADSRTNAKFIDVTKKFLGHAANSADPWLVMILAPVPPFDRLPDANFHPNEAGHLAYAAALLSAVKPAQLAKR